jgi:hypothetical protein
VLGTWYKDLHLYLTRLGLVFWCHQSTTDISWYITCALITLPETHIVDTDWKQAAVLLHGADWLKRTLVTMTSPILKLWESCQTLSTSPSLLFFSIYKLEYVTDSSSVVFFECSQTTHWLSPNICLQQCHLPSIAKYCRFCIVQQNIPFLTIFHPLMCMWTNVHA